MHSNNVSTGAPALTHSAMVVYGIGRAAEAIKNRVFETFLFFYYVQVLEVPGSYAGIAVGIALAVDGISDPLTGSVSDRFRSRWGRRHPFMFLSVFPLTITFLLLMIPPDLSALGLAVWLCVFASLARASITLFHVPHMSLGPELVPDYDRRTTVVLIRNILGIVGSATAFFVGFSYFFRSTDEFANGQLNAAAYPPYAITMAVLMVICILVCVFGTRRQIPYLSTPRVERAFHISDIYQDVLLSLQSPSFRRIFIGIMLFSVYGGVHSTMTVHMGTYFWELSPAEFTKYAVIVSVGAVLGLPLAWLVIRILDKKWAYLSMIGSSALLTTLPVVLRLVGWFPDNDDPLFLPLYFGMMMFGVSAGIAATTAASTMVMDTTDEHEARTGERQEGAFYGAISFSSKVASATGHVVGGFVIDLIRFPLGSAVKPGTVDPEILWQMGFVFGPAVMVLPVVSIWISSRYEIDRKRHEEIMVEIRRRRSLPSESGD